MTAETDLLLDRRRLKRRLSLWRAGAVLFAAAAVLLLVGRYTGVMDGFSRHVARLTVSGFISDDRRLIEAIDKAGRDDRVRALIVSIDSPGGSVGGGEALHAALLRFREKKPVVAVMRGTAASAAYMTAVAADRILARETTVTGSIGVLMQSFDTSDLLARLGVHPETLTSGPLKDNPSLFHPMTPEGRAALQNIVADLYAQFVSMVAAGRHLPEDAVRAVADGRVLTGRQALAAKLVDAIGDEHDARAWLESARQVPASLPTEDLSVQSSTGRALGLALGSAAKSLVSEWLGVDGPVAVWQPRF